ncbi:hypothetical protein SUGI_0091600 [Cryptomeria japonica]|uniref:uncharacterized protein LOC131057152 n=1 Tax=Cryptomeria japonica TaxID=3369 RepID=UPI002408939B|nr:uncharacterized protein LOC131057152 [Cryptomeria japonica]GLJ08571.1 hypothetical protein SUGI_0091600 [Cryptomeria japonica]
MALKLGFLTSLAPEISVGSSIKHKYNKNAAVSSSRKDTETLLIGLRHHYILNSCSGVKIRTASPPAAAANRTEESGVSEESPDEYRSAGSSVQSQLDILERLTSNSTVNLEGSWQSQVPSKKIIREQLSELVSNDVGEATIPLGKRFKPPNLNSLTISQKRNIKRQDYLNKVAKRNDIPFFTTIALFVILPPIVILGVSVATGYVELFP